MSRVPRLVRREYSLKFGEQFILIGQDSSNTTEIFLFSFQTSTEFEPRTDRLQFDGFIFALLRSAWNRWGHFEQVCPLKVTARDEARFLF